MGASYTTVPVELNALRGSDHAFDEIDIAYTTQYEAGERRRRQIYTQVPDILNFSWDMTQAQLDIYYDWKENVLISLERQFDVTVAQEGGTGVTWSNAKFITEPEVDAVDGGDYLVTGQMLLLGDRFDVRVAPTLYGKATITFSSIATLAPIDTLTAVAVIEFTTNADLERLVRATEDGSIRVTMDGDERGIS